MSVVPGVNLFQLPTSVQDLIKTRQTNENKDLISFRSKITLDAPQGLQEQYESALQRMVNAQKVPRPKWDKANNEDKQDLLNYFGGALQEQQSQNLINNLMQYAQKMVSKKGIKYKFDRKLIKKNLKEARQQNNKEQIDYLTQLSRISKLLQQMKRIINLDKNTLTDNYITAAMEYNRARKLTPSYVIQKRLQIAKTLNAVNQQEYNTQKQVSAMGQAMQIANSIAQQLPKRSYPSNEGINLQSIYNAKLMGLKKILAKGDIQGIRRYANFIIQQVNENPKALQSIARFGTLEAQEELRKYFPNLEGLAIKAQKQIQQKQKKVGEIELEDDNKNFEDLTAEQQQQFQSQK